MTVTQTTTRTHCHPQSGMHPSSRGTRTRTLTQSDPARGRSPRGPKGLRKKLFTNINGIHPCIHCSPARGSVPEQHRCWLLLRQRHRLDGLCALRHLPCRPGVQGRRQLLCSGRPVHHPDCHHRLHGCEDCGLQRDHPRPQHPAARLRGDPLKWTRRVRRDLSGQGTDRPHHHVR